MSLFTQAAIAITLFTLGLMLALSATITGDYFPATIAASSCIFSGLLIVLVWRNRK
jgi:hypothetical protein